MPRNTYWGNTGLYQDMCTKLEELVPLEGPIEGTKNKKLEKFRRASNCYYDIFNNGGGNRNRETSRVFPGALREFNRRYSVNWDAIYNITEPVMDKIICEAFAEQFPREMSMLPPIELLQNKKV